MIDTSKPVKIKGEDWPVTIVDVDFNGNIGAIVDCDGIKSFHVFNKKGELQNRYGDMTLVCEEEEVSVWANVYAPSNRNPSGVISSPRISREEAQIAIDRSGFCGERVAMLKLIFRGGKLWDMRTEIIGKSCG